MKGKTGSVKLIFEKGIKKQYALLGIVTSYFMFFLLRLYGNPFLKISQVEELCAPVNIKEFEFSE